MGLLTESRRPPVHVRAGLLEKPNLSGIHDFRILSKVLEADGGSTVGAAGLGTS